MCAAPVTAPPALRFGTLWSSPWGTLADLPEPALPGVRRWDAQFDRSHFFRRASHYCLLTTSTVHRLSSVPSRGRRTARYRRLYSRDTRRCHAVRASKKRPCTSEAVRSKRTDAHQSLFRFLHISRRLRQDYPVALLHHSLRPPVSMWRTALPPTMHCCGVLVFVVDSRWYDRPCATAILLVDVLVFPSLVFGTSC